MEMIDESKKDFKRWVDYISVDDISEIIQDECIAYITTGDDFLWTQFEITFLIGEEKHVIRFALNPELAQDWVKALIKKDRDSLGDE